MNCGECGAGGARRVYPIGVMDGDVYYACPTCEAELRSEHLLYPHPTLGPGPTAGWLHQPHPHERILVALIVAGVLSLAFGVPSLIIDLIHTLTR